jgi:hypothetical protein
MATNTLIMGESGTGKSTSIRNLNPKETFIINVLDKPLPFKGFKANYTKFEKGAGNYFASDDHAAILRVINIVNRQRQDIKHVIIDDFQYIMANEFMRRARENGFAKFTEIAQHAWEILKTCSEARDDLHFFVLSHTESDAAGKVKIKTIGKMMDEKITVEGMFTVVLHTLIIDGQHKFLTQNDGVHIAKSPMGMFDSQMIDNDLLAVKNKIDDYFGYDTDWYANLEEERNNKEAEEERKYSLAIDSINAAGNLSELRDKYAAAWNTFQGNEKILSDLIIAKDNMKKTLQQGAQH